MVTPAWKHQTGATSCSFPVFPLSCFSLIVTMYAAGAKTDGRPWRSTRDFPLFGRVAVDTLMFSEKSITKSLFIIAFLAATATAPAQQKIASVRIFTEPAGLQFRVDGQEFRGAVTLLWPAGSKHSIATAPQQQELDGRTHYSLISNPWSTNLGQPDVVDPFTADPDLTFLKVTFQTYYALDLTYFLCPEGTVPPTCQSPGTVFVNHVQYVESTRLFFPAGTPIIAEAFPNPGFVFTGWSASPSVSNKTQAFILTFLLNAPAHIQPLLPSARPISITVQTDPPGLKLLADRTNITAPMLLEWGWDSVHTLGALSPQMDTQGRIWVYDSWSDGGAATHSYNMTRGYTTDSVTARFVRAARVSFLTMPSGLKLKVDGRENWPDYNFSWAVGAVHTVSAADQQYDAQKRKYQFQSWSNGGPATQSITVSDSIADGARYTVNYQPVGVLQVGSSPAGLRVQVDGDSCYTPCAIERAPGTGVQINAAASLTVADGARLDFLGWSDNQPADRSVTVFADPKTITANYQLRYRLSAEADPADGAKCRIQPGSVDGFFDAQSDVVVAVDTNSGFRFRNWDGDLSGISKTAQLNMSAPKSVRAVLDRVPYIPPLGIQNAAAVTPDAVLAPGSIVSIFGLNLAADQAASPDGPLAQALGDVTVRSAGRLLPLFFVSPGQINVQLPSDLPEGRQTLTVRWEGKPEVSASFTVARNAPGLFNTVADGRAFGIATHPDGTAVSIDSPAKHGEIVTFLGTGFGRLNRTPLDGFPVPQSDSYQLIDPVSVVLGDAIVTPVSAGAVAGRVGMTSLRVQITDDFPQATTVELKVRVNGRESNTVLLPLE